ncbi:hypothetical protein [Candidatus Mycolicibacterium alkanivorans]|uniref:Uncharacterized protein n=1 Tax=Candidatus Mycolicibacterium alkanivorans TaxID=2954114 RepID=A0ABS9YX67_9MYCO|nr:hypothetical protein [Candidatus Mycolicibacterium alkanivorans]MCI4675439.1 hypothetical protein [Candidatus Mycolicibacterium alkanivorans]
MAADSQLSDDRDSARDVERLGLRHEDLREHTTRHVDHAARRLRRLVRGFLDRASG